MTVDEILATGKYTDRLGRAWNYDPDFDVWVEYSSRDDGILHLGWIVDTKDVRLLIERDLHECDGMGELPDCQGHPVPIVIVGYDEGEWGEFRVRFRGSSVTYSSHPDAMDAARALAVGE